MPDPERELAPGERSSGQLPRRHVPEEEAPVGRPPGERREAELSAEQRAGLRHRQVVQDRTLRAMHQLESALASVASRREGPWRREVLQALAVLESATTAEAENAERPDSLLADIARTQPRLRNRARAVRIAYRQLREAIAAIRRELGDPGHGTDDDAGSADVADVAGGSEALDEEGEAEMVGVFDVADVRYRLAWILSGLRQQRARESDLIYEAYFDAFRADLAAESDPGLGSRPDE